jgi:DNA-binding MarR family transcriptional regulator
VTRLVDKLETDGLVERTSCPSDARGAFAQLTDAGLEALRRAYPTHLASVRRHVFDRLGAERLPGFTEAVCALTDTAPKGRDPGPAR